MTKHFHRDLENLQKEILSLSSRVEDMIDSAGRCLFEPNRELAREVIEADKQVDQREVSIEEECLKMLALHQPVAIDLRRIAAVLKINHDLERIGDLAVNIVQRADCLHQRPDFRMPAKLERMARLATSMVRGTLNAFVDSDVDAAREICLSDDEVDDINREIIERADHPHEATAGDGRTRDALFLRDPPPGTDRRPCHEHCRGRNLPGPRRNRAAPRTPARSHRVKPALDGRPRQM